MTCSKMRSKLQKKTSKRLGLYNKNPTSFWWGSFVVFVDPASIVSHIQHSPILNAVVKTKGVLYEITLQGHI